MIFGAKLLRQLANFWSFSTNAFIALFYEPFLDAFTEYCSKSPFQDSVTQILTLLWPSVVKLRILARVSQHTRSLHICTVYR